MTSVQKIIKNIALALAVFLIVSIISGILSALYALSGVLGLKNEDTKINNEMSMIDFENGEIATLDIDVNFTNLIIKNGDTLRAETNNKDINCKQNNQNLQIKEKQHNLQRINNTKPQHNKTAHLWTKSEGFYYENLRIKICTGIYQDGERRLSAGMA